MIRMIIILSIIMIIIIWLNINIKYVDYAKKRRFTLILFKTMLVII